MKSRLKYLLLIFALCLSNVAFGQSEYDVTDTTNVPAEPERREIARRHGGSANRGTVYFFYENKFNVGRPDLRFIDTVKSLFHRYDPIIRNNAFRSSRGNVGLISDDLEFFFRNDILFSYGRSPFELYRFTPFNTKFYQNVLPYVELYYVQGGGERMQNFRMLFTQNVMRGLNVGAEYNAILSPGVYNRSFTRHNNIRVFSNFISENQRYRAVAGYYFNRFQSHENGGILTPHGNMMTPDSLHIFANQSNKRVIPIRLQQAENDWRENSFYLRQSFHFGINRNRNRTANDELENGYENGYENANGNGYENGNSLVSNGTDSRINFGSLSHALKVNRFSTVFNDRQLEPINYPDIFRDSSQTRDSTFVELIRNTLSWNLGDVTSFQNSQFLNLSLGATVDFARVRIGRDTILDAVNDLSIMHSRDDLNRNFSYLYPFAGMRLNFRDQYFLSAGIMYQMDLNDLSNNLSAFSANAQFDYFFNRTRSNDGFFAEANFSRVLPRPFQQFYVSNHFEWNNSFRNPETLHLAVGARWRGFHLRSEFATFNNFIYLTPTNFAQANQSFSIFKTSLEKTFRFWRILALDTRLVYQHNTSNTIMQLPAFSTRTALFFDFNLLGTTPIQVGLEAFYNTRFHSRFFNPALGMFYDQRELQTGGFVFADAFLNLRVARANVFFKMNNLGANLFGYNYMMTNGYPIPYRTFSFGVLWRFYD